MSPAVIRPLDLLPLTVACATCVSTCAVERWMGYKSFTPFYFYWGGVAGFAGSILGTVLPALTGRVRLSRHHICSFAAREHCGEICSDIGMSLVSLLLSVVVWTITSGLAAATCAFFLVVAHLLKLTDVYAPHGLHDLLPEGIGQAIMGGVCILLALLVFSRFSFNSRDGWYITGAYLFDGRWETSWKAMF